MNYSRFILIFALVFAAVSAVRCVTAAQSGSSYPAKGMDLEIGTGYRVDRIDWNIAGNTSGTSPNVLSELTWTDLEITEFSVLGRKTVKNIYLKGSFSLGFIHSGENWDSDYAGDDRTVEYSRSENNGGAGTVWDLSVAGGDKRWVLTAGGGAFTFRPLIGFSAHKQNLTITDGFQTVCTSPCTNPLGPFAGLDSTYKALWIGPWAGFEADYSSGAFALYGTLEMHGAVYRAEADWNLRSDWQHPVSFEHEANAIGVVLSLGADYAVTESLAVVAALKHQDWHAFSGTDRTYFSGGAVGETRLNEVNWISNAFTIGLKYIY